MTPWAVVLNAQAEEQVEEIQAWWRKHRRAAPTLFLDELSDTVVRLTLIPELGQPIEHADFPSLRRWLMERTKYHVYFIADPAKRKITIMAVWGAQRGSPPDLGE